MSFSELGLDPVLVQSAKRHGFHTPTEIQRACITAVLKGFDVVALSKTGTGKTAAYVLPVLHKLLDQAETKFKPWMVLILVPTKELILQVSGELKSMINLALLEIRVSSVTVSGVTEMQRDDVGPIVVCTPRQMSLLLQKSDPGDQVVLEQLAMLVVDEADLILSYGYDADMKYIAPRIPRSCQCILASATRSSDLDAIVKLVMENPHRIDLLSKKQSRISTGAVSHCYLKCNKEDRAVHILALLQFRSIEQPVMIFVNSINEGYRLRLFLDCFKIASSLLHRELPQNSRKGLIESFNQGRSAVFIVVDDLHSQFLKEDKTRKKKSRIAEKAPSKEAEFGVARGLDFKNVRTVINFDLPQTVNGYIHRVGRTGRAGNSGTALTFFDSKDDKLEKEIAGYLNDSAEDKEEVFRAFVNFNQHHVAALKYRASDVMQSLNRRAIEAARKKDLGHAILKSPELESYFKVHPTEKKLLETLDTSNIKSKFSTINKLPSYIVSPEAANPEPEHAAKRPRHVPKIDPLTEKAAVRRRRGKKRSSLV